MEAARTLRLVVVAVPLSSMAKWVVVAPAVVKWVAAVSWAACPVWLVEVPHPSLGLAVWVVVVHWPSLVVVAAL